MSPSPLAVPGRARRRGAAALLALLTALSAAAVPAGATTTDGPVAARLVVSALTAVVGPAQEDTVPEGEESTGVASSLTARLLVENPGTSTLDSLRVVVTVHRRVTTRSELRRALDPATSDAGPVEVVAVDRALDPLGPGDVAQVEVSIPAEAAGLVDTDDDVTIHPVTLSVVRAVSVLDQTRVAAIGVARPIARPLETVVVAPLDADVARDAEANADLLPGGRLDRLLRAVERAPIDAVTLAPAPHAAEQLADLVAAAAPGATDMATRLASTVAERGAGVLSMPYALADVPALASSSSTEALATQAILAGRRRLTSGLEVEPDAAHLLVSPQTTASVELAPTDILVTSWDATSGPDLVATPTADIPPALRTGRSPAGRGLTVLVGDPWIADALASADGEHGWTVDAHRAVAETAMLFAQAPGRGGRVVAVVPPVGWAAPGLLADELYARLAQAPWLRLDDPVAVAARGVVTAPWTGLGPLVPDRTILLGRVATAQNRLDGLAAAVSAAAAPDVVARSDDLLRAMSVWPSPDPDGRADQLLTTVEEDTAAAIGTVTVPDDSVVTLASERGVIPVTIQHPDGVPLDVVVEVAAQGRLSFTDGTSRSVRLEEGGTATVSFEAIALSRGTFPMAVTVRTPGREVVLGSSLVRVRATAVSQPALVVIGGVVVLLLLIGRLRRPRQPQLEVVR